MSRMFTSRVCVYQICRCVMWWSRKAHSAVVGLLLIPSVLPELSDVCCKHVGLRVVQCVRQALEDLTSSFGLRVADVKLKLTSREIEVCNFVKNGLSSKEIADMLKIAVHTVEKHRRTARSKLGLANKGINLRTYLKSIQ